MRRGDAATEVFRSSGRIEIRSSRTSSKRSRSVGLVPFASIPAPSRRTRISPTFRALRSFSVAGISIGYWGARPIVRRNVLWPSQKNPPQKTTAFFSSKSGKHTRELAAESRSQSVRHPATAVVCGPTPCMGDLEWFQCGYLPRRWDSSGGDDTRATLTPCFPRDGDNDDDDDIGKSRPSLTTVFPGGWGFALGCEKDGTLWSWGAVRDYLFPEDDSETEDDGGAKRMVRGVAPAAAGFATVFALTSATTTTNRPGELTRIGWGAAWKVGANDLPFVKISVKQLAAGDEFCVALTENGHAFSVCGECGTAPTAFTEPFDSEPIPVTDENGCVHFSYVAAGSKHCVLVSTLGEVWSFGWGLYGQLGRDGCEDATEPTRIESLRGVGKFVAAAAGYAHTVCLTSNGSVYAFGGNHDGQLGVPFDNCALGAATGTPALVEFPWDDENDGDKNTFVAQISCGARHTAVVTTESELCVWGWNGYGQLGVGDLERRTVPTKVTASGTVQSVACGRWHTAVGISSRSS